MAAQEQALNTNSIKKSIYKTSESYKSRMFRSATESVTHIISQCTVLSQKEYKRLHDKVGQNVHWQLCKKYGFECGQNWYQHVPAPVFENEEIKLL